MDIATNIRSLRESHGLSTSDLAEIVGVGRTTVTMWEIGQSHPSLLVLLRTIGDDRVDSWLRDLFVHIVIGHYDLDLESILSKIAW